MFLAACDPLRTAPGSHVLQCMGVWQGIEASPGKRHKIKQSISPHMLVCGACCGVSPQSLDPHVYWRLLHTSLPVQHASHVQVSYCDGPYNSPEGFRKLVVQMQEYEKSSNAKTWGRLFYLALPPSVYLDVLTNIRHATICALCSGTGHLMQGGPCTLAMHVRCVE